MVYPLILNSVPLFIFSLILLQGMSSLDEISASIISDRDPREPEEEREYSDLILDQTQVDPPAPILNSCTHGSSTLALMDP